jgi:hypothetical protein
MAAARSRGRLDRLLDAMLAGDWPAALRLAASYPDLGAEAAAIRRAHEATVRPQFYEQLGRNVVAEVEAGIAALRHRYAAALEARPGAGPPRCWTSKLRGQHPMHCKLPVGHAGEHAFE